MRVLFIGGPGRSGTSFVADRLGDHPQVVALKDIELKIFCEKNGLQDLFHSLVLTYSPNRAVMALDQFRRMAHALVTGRYGQPGLSVAAPARDWSACFDAFADSLLEDGHPVPQPPERFFNAARALLGRIAALAAGAASGEPAPAAPDGTIFLEKTPHNLLAIGFLTRIAPGARFLHVMRDPRSIAWSLLAMRWGPDDLTTAARWVDSYCRAWTVAEGHAARLALPLTRAYIEEVASAPAEAAGWLSDRLGIGPLDGLFHGADPSLLNRWAAGADPAERAMLDSRLDGWVRHFGYDPGRVGWRPCSTLPGPSPVNPARPRSARPKSARSTRPGIEDPAHTGARGPVPPPG